MKHKNNYHYIVTVKFNKGYFNNPTEPLIRELNYYCGKPATFNRIQSCYQNGTVISFKEATS